MNLKKSVLMGLVATTSFIIPSLAQPNASLAIVPAPVSLWSGEGDFLDTFENNDGTEVGSIGFSPAEVGMGFDFNGSSGNFVEIADDDSLDFTSALTITTWVNIRDTSSRRILDKITAGVGDGWLLDTLNNRFRFIASGLSTPSLSSNSTLPLNEFTHIAAVYDGSSISLYLNGVLDATTPSTGLLTINSLNARIGANSNGGNLFNGIIDELGVWDVALTAEQINEVATEGIQIASVPESNIHPLVYLFVSSLAVSSYYKSTQKKLK